MTDEEIKQERKLVLSLYVTDKTFGYETDLSPEEAVFWLDVVKGSLIAQVLEAEPNE